MPGAAGDDGVITIHMLQGNATLGVGSKNDGTNVDANGPDVIVLEVWRVPVPCPADGDTHVTGVDVSEDEGGGGGEADCTRDYIVTVTAEDDSDDDITYWMSATDGVTTLDAGPQAENSTTFTLTPGVWTISVSVDDDPDCDDAAKDSSVEVEVTVGDCGVGPFKRGDANDSGEADLSDAQTILSWLFQGTAEPPCLAAANTNGEDQVSLTSAVYLLSFLFQGGPAPIPPFPDCGNSTLPNDVAIGCLEYTNCP